MTLADIRLEDAAAYSFELSFVDYASERFRPTGKRGIVIETGVRSSEYRSVMSAARLWLDEHGSIHPD